MEEYITHADDHTEPRGSSGSITPLTIQSMPIAALMDDSLDAVYSRPVSSFGSSSPEEGEIVQVAGSSAWSDMLDSGYHAPTHDVHAYHPVVTDLYFPVGAWNDVTYVYPDRSGSEDLSSFPATPSAMSNQLQPYSGYSGDNSELAVSGQVSPWNNLNATASNDPMQWIEYVPTMEHENFANSSRVYGLPMFSLKMTPSDPYVMMNETEHRLDQRMGSLYGNPNTYDKVCSRKFGSTLAEWYREDVRQLAHCVSDCHKRFESMKVCLTNLRRDTSWSNMRSLRAWPETP